MQITCICKLFALYVCRKNIKGKRMETVVDDGLHKVQITDGVVFETREQIPEIEEYLENILDQNLGINLRCPSTRRGLSPCKKVTSSSVG